LDRYYNQEIYIYNPLSTAKEIEHLAYAALLETLPSIKNDEAIAVFADYVEEILGPNKANVLRKHGTSFLNRKHIINIIRESKL